MYDIVRRAYRKRGIAAVDTALEADDATEGNDALNAMIFGWKLRGVDTGHTTKELTDTFPLDPEFEEGTAFLLASRLSPDYMVPASFDADDWFRGFQAAYMTIEPATIPGGLLKLPSQYARRKGSRGGFESA